MNELMQQQLRRRRRRRKLTTLIIATTTTIINYKVHDDTSHKTKTKEFSTNNSENDIHFNFFLFGNKREKNRFESSNKKKTDKKK